MRCLSDDDLNLAGMSDEELARAWDLWFDLAQVTNDDDPVWTHGVFVLLSDAVRAANGSASAGAGTPWRP